MARSAVFVAAVFLLFLALPMASTGVDAGRSLSEVDKWPALVGVDKAVAEETIEKDRPDLTVYLVPVDSVVTADYRTDRVRIFYGTDGKVATVPIVG